MADKVVTVKKGDTLSAIAKANNTTVKAIQQANPQITNVNSIKPNQVFTIPGVKGPETSVGPTGGGTGGTGTGSTGTGGSGGVQKEPTKTPQYDSAGKLIGYIVTTYSANGSANPSTFEATAPIATVKDTTATQGAFDKFKAGLEAEGLGDLANDVVSLIKSENAPTTSEGYYLALTQTPTYQKRFGETNAARIKNGLQPLTEGEIMKLESGYKNIMQSYGLPAGFYDSPEDYKTFITNDLSASELADRVQAAQSAVQLTDPTLRQQLKDYYGLDTSATTAYLLDPTKGEQILNQLASKNTAAIAAAQSGYDVGAAQVAQSLGGSDLSYAKQAEAFAKSRGLASETNILANIYGGKYNTAQGMQEAFGGAGATSAAGERERLSNLEKSTFGGSAGVDKGSLGVEQTGIL
jgi:nucleoid-associated protein YgaU